jgi:hypothetical protein
MNSNSSLFYTASARKKILDQAARNKRENETQEKMQKLLIKKGKSNKLKQ